MRLFQLLCLIPALCAGAAQALTFEISGATMRLSGAIRAGDAAAFQAHLASSAGRAIKIIQLHSGGGSIREAAQMARLIRSLRLTTFVDGRTDHCSSACTLLFVAGTARHYAGDGGIHDGVIGHGLRGLGFHEGSDEANLSADRYSAPATVIMQSLYAEFNVPAARSLVAQAPPRKIYQLSPTSALTLGISTSMARP